MKKKFKTQLKGFLTLLSLVIFIGLTLFFREFIPLMYLVPSALAITTLLSLKKFISKQALLIISWLFLHFLTLLTIKAFENIFFIISPLFILFTAILFSYLLKDIKFYKEDHLRVAYAISTLIIILFSVFYFDLNFDCIGASLAEKGVSEFRINRCKLFGLYSPRSYAPFWTGAMHYLFILFTWGPAAIFASFQLFPRLKREFKN